MKDFTPTPLSSRLPQGMLSFLIIRPDQETKQTPSRTLRLRGSIFFQIAYYS